MKIVVFPPLFRAFNRLRGFITSPVYFELLSTRFYDNVCAFLVVDECLEVWWEWVVGRIVFHYLQFANQTDVPSTVHVLLTDCKVLIAQALDFTGMTNSWVEIISGKAIFSREKLTLKRRNQHFFQISKKVNCIFLKNVLFFQWKCFSE